MIGKQFLRAMYTRFLRQVVNPLFFRDLIETTDNFSSVSWLGYPIWQNILDLWTIQETIALVRPGLLIECGTNRGGSSLFFAHLFDLMGQGEVVTVDIQRLHNLTHPRITYLIGSSTSDEIVRAVQRKAAACTGPVMVILDSDHSREHVRRELECYAPLVTPGSYCLVQDGVIDQLSIFRRFRAGPLPAIEDFVRATGTFEIDAEKCGRFLITHHPNGWLRRRLGSAEKTCNEPFCPPAAHSDRHGQVWFGEIGATRLELTRTGPMLPPSRA